MGLPRSVTPRWSPATSRAVTIPMRKPPSSLPVPLPRNRFDRGCDLKPIQSDDELLDWVRNNAETTYYPVVTCKMGSDSMALVDDQLRVRGIQGLRVADASIMPTLTSGNTNALSIMIGETASRMILAAAA